MMRQNHLKASSWAKVVACPCLARNVRMPAKASFLRHDRNSHQQSIKCGEITLVCESQRSEANPLRACTIVFYLLR